MIQKSITMNAGADGRSFACVNGTWSLPAVQRVDYNNSFQIYPVGYTDTTSTATPYPFPGPKYGMPSSAYDPSPYYNMSTHLGPESTIPKFLIAQNTTDSIVSPKITLSCRDNISLGIGVASEIQVDALNPVLATFSASSSSVGQLMAFTGLITGSDVVISIYDPLGNNYLNMPQPAGYFAYPMKINAPGTFALYFESNASSYVTITPSFLSPTSMTVGQLSTGTMTIPEQLTEDALISGDQLPSQIVALSYSVTKGDQYAFAFTVNDLLGAASEGKEYSYYTCYCFEVGTDGSGAARVGILGLSVPSMPPAVYYPVVSEAVATGTLYVVLVGNYVSRFQYSMGVEPATVPTAPLNTPWDLMLPTPPTNMSSQLYQFSIPSESMVIMNYTDVSNAATIQADILKVTPTGTVYDTGSESLGSRYFQALPAEFNYYNAMYMGAGNYMLDFYIPSGSAEAYVEINTYPIANFTLGSSLSMGVHTTKALAINVTPAFQFNTFNVTLTSQLNASMTYVMSVFDSQNNILSVYLADGRSLLFEHPGLGNKESSGSWGGTSGLHDTVDGLLNFGGNESTQINQFVPTYAGRYFIILSFLNGYNTTLDGSALHPWSHYNNLVMTLKINLSPPDLAAMGVYEIRYVSLDSSSGSGTTSVTFTSTSAPNVRLIALALTPEIDTWTRVTVTIINGTDGDISNVTHRTGNLETLYSILEPNGISTFDPGNYLPFLPSLTYYMVNGHAPGRQNATYNIEFGAFTKQMMIAFAPWVYGSGIATHTVVTIKVTHFATQGISGLVPIAGTPPAAASAPFPTTLVIVIAAVVVIALVIVFIVVRKRSGSHTKL
jgi:hypothetical protein